MNAVEVLRTVMKDCNVSQQRLADAIGVNQQNVCYACRNTPTTEMLVNAMNAMGYEIVVRPARGGALEKNAYRITGTGGYVPVASVKGQYNNIAHFKGDMSAYELSKRLGVSRQRVAKYMEAESLHEDTLRKIAHVLGCDWEQLICDTDYSNS